MTARNEPLVLAIIEALPTSWQQQIRRPDDGSLTDDGGELAQTIDDLIEARLNPPILSTEGVTVGNFPPQSDSSAPSYLLIDRDLYRSAGDQISFAGPTLEAIRRELNVRARVALPPAEDYPRDVYVVNWDGDHALSEYGLVYPSIDQHGATHWYQVNSVREYEAQPDDRFTRLVPVEAAP